MSASDLRKTLVVVLILIGSAKGEEPRIRTDLYGDPLPPGALVRLGTIRLRHYYAAVAFSPDGGALISAGEEGTIRYWETSSGKESRRVRVQTAEPLYFPIVLAANGKTLAGGTADTLRVWDTATGKERRRFPLEKLPFPDLKDRSVQLVRLALSPDGKRLATALYDLKSHYVRVWEVETGKQLPTLKLPQFSGDVVFSLDGKRLGTVGDSEAIVWDTASGKVIRKIAGPNRGLTFSPDGKRLAAVCRDGVKVWSLADGKECFALKTLPKGYLSSLTYSPSGNILVVGSEEGLLLWDVAGAKELRTIPSHYGGLRFSPDGKTAASFSGSAMHLWDMATGKEIAPRPGHEGAVTSLAIAPDGSSIATCSDNDRVVRIWDAATGQPLVHTSGHKRYARSGVFSPDGRFVLSAGGDNLLRVWDRKTGKEARTFLIESAEPARTNLQVMAVTLSSDGERLASLAVSGDVFSTFQVNVWDMATGKSLARRSLPSGGFDTRFSPDLRNIANQSGNEIVVEDTVTGQEIVKTAGQAPLAFSPDGKILAATIYKPPPSPQRIGHMPEEAEAIVLTELATGKQLARIETGRNGFALLAYSPDGRTLATADQDCFRLWDVASGKELLRRALPERHRQFGYSFAASLAYFPGGGKLATGLRDSTVLIWDLEPKTWRSGMDVKDLDRRDLERLWSELAGEDAGKAHRAVWTLAAVPVKAVPFLKDRLHPAPVLNVKELQRLISDLDSPEFAVRESARKKLAALGEQAEPALRQALQGKPSLEVRKRLEALRADAEWAGRGMVRSAEVLRTLRAIRSLKHMGSDEAREVLQLLADGDPSARTTHCARDALRRLK